MPRPKSFVVEDVLDVAIELFAERGYDNSTMETLTQRVGLSRSSVYATFVQNPVQKSH
jgi:AcrR family transcriptional regulator